MRTRGGDFKNPPTKEDSDNAVKFLSEAYGLLNGALNGYSVFRQTEGFSEAGQAIRDEVVHALGSITGFDVEGEMNQNEQDDISVVLADGDIDSLGIDPELKGEPVLADYRTVVFGAVASRKVWQVNEYEVPNNVISLDETGVEIIEERFMRILNVQLASPEA